MKLHQELCLKHESWNRMAYLNKGFWKVDTEIFIGVRDKRLKAKVVKAPIFKNQIQVVK